jgi:hypothetical protein
MEGKPELVAAINNDLQVKQNRFRLRPTSKWQTNFPILQLTYSVNRRLILQVFARTAVLGCKAHTAKWFVRHVDFF